MSDQRTSTADSATEPLQADKSLGELFGDLTSDLSRLFRQEVELAKTEASQELKRAGKASAMLAGAGLGGWMALLFLSLGLAWLLDQALNTALAFAIVGVLWALIAMVLAASGKKRLATVEALPTTVHSLKEDVEWAKTQKN
jgi:F0F1-type ATP synthase assembly protein I